MKNWIDILYLTYDGLLDPLGQSQILPYLRGLHKEGYRFHIVSLEKRTPNEEDRKQLFEDPDYWHWHPLPYKRGIPLWSQFQMVQQLVRKAEEIAHQHPVLLVHCRSYLAALAGSRIQQKMGVKFLFDMRGFWADERVEGGIWNTGNPFYAMAYRYFKRKEAQWINECDGLISLTENAAGYIEQNFEIDASKIAIIPCCTDMRVFHPNEGANKEYDWAYVGSIGTWYMLDEMLDFFALYRQKHTKARFLFLTTEPAEIINSGLSDRGLPISCVTIKSVPHQEVAFWLNKSRFGLFFIRPSFSKRASFPTKLAEYVGLNIPVVTNSGIGDLDSWVPQQGVGWVLPDFEKESMIQIMSELRDGQLPLDNFEIARQKLDISTGISQYGEVYRKLLV